MILVCSASHCSSPKPFLTHVSLESIFAYLCHSCDAPIVGRRVSIRGRTAVPGGLAVCPQKSDGETSESEVQREQEVDADR